MHRAGPLSLFLIACAPPACIAGALAQAPQHGWQPVQPGRADVSPLAWSLQYVQPSLQSPSGFDRVYRLRSPSDLYARAATEGGLFARASGGITAVFPVSQYVQTPRGEQPVIPAGTIFVLGDPARLLAAPPRQQAPLRLGDATTYVGGTPATRAPQHQDLKADSLSPPPPRGLQPPSLPAVRPEALPRRSLWENEQYRRERLATRLAEVRDAR